MSCLVPALLCLGLVAGTVRFQKSITPTWPSSSLPTMLLELLEIPDLFRHFQLKRPTTWHFWHHLICQNPDTSLFWFHNLGSAHDQICHTNHNAPCYLEFDLEEYWTYFSYCQGLTSGHQLLHQVLCWTSNQSPEPPRTQISSSRYDYHQWQQEQGPTVPWTNYIGTSK